MTQENVSGQGAATAASVTAEKTRAETRELPKGGTSAQVLAKNSATDFDVGWVNQTGGGGGGKGEQFQTISIPGVLSTGITLQKLLFPFAATFDGVTACLGTTSTPTDLIVDVLKGSEGVTPTSLFLSANRPKVKAGLLVGAEAKTIIAPATIAASEFLVVEIVQTSGSASELVVTVRYH